MARSRMGCRMLALVLAGMLELGAARAPAQELVHTFPGMVWGRPLAFSADDRYLASVVSGRGSREAWATVWEVATGREISRLPTDQGHLEMAFLPSGTTLAVFDFPHGSMTLWDFKSGQVRTIVGNELEPKESMPRRMVSPCMSPDGALVAFSRHDSGNNSVIRVRQLADEKLVAEFKVGDEMVTRLVFRRDGRTLMAEGQRYEHRKEQYQVRVYQCDLQSGEKANEWGPFPMTGQPTRHSAKDYGFHCMAADGRTLATTLLGNGVLVIDVTSGQNMKVGPHPTTVNLATARAGFFGGVPGSVINALSFTPDGTQLVTGAWGSSTVHFWPVSARAARKQIDQPDIVSVLALRFSPSGRLLAVTGPKDAPMREYLVHVWRFAAE